MKTFLICICLISSVAILSAQTEIADVRISSKTNNNPFLRSSPPKAGRYELHTATMLDLTRIAYGFDPDKVLGGPNWLEMNRYDVTVKVPVDATQETANTILQSVLEDRFKLTVHKDTKPLPTWALTMGKKNQMKEADGTGDAGCKPKAETAPPTPGDGVTRIGINGVVLALGPGQVIQYLCRNMTMESFVGTMRTLFGSALGPNPVLDQTGLKGMWNFDLKYSINIIVLAGESGDRISFPDAIDKQLGLKLEQHPVPTPVLVVDSVEEKPSPNPPAVAEALPPITLPTEFEVADIKPASSVNPPNGPFRFGMQPGGRYTIPSVFPFSTVLQQAFNVQTNDYIVGLPQWANSARYEITAKAAVDPGVTLDQDAQSVLLLSLLKERFGLKYHTEERPLSAYSLVAAKPKLKKADPNSRTSCKRSNGPSGTPAGTILLTCQNITMAQFAEQLRGIAQGLYIPPVDSTGLDGAWDFTLTWNQRAGMPQLAAAKADGAGDGPAASDPNGGYTIFEAIEKQLGLKLEQQKRPVPVYVIDQLNEKPTDN
jgi:uncharacterized protein (TIGR03435 family)